MNREFIQKLSEIVDEHLADENFGPEQLAEKMGMSHSSLHRKLKEISNQTISQFIREVRLNKAKVLLLSEEITISEIAYKVGFSSATYFNKCFHDYFGLAPGEFKKQELENEPEIEIKKSKQKKKIQKVFLFFVAPVLILISVFLFLNEKYSILNNNSEEKSIVLRPFGSQVDNTEKEYLVGGISDAILQHLSAIEDLRVMSKTSISPDSEENSKKIGRKYGVSHILEGSLQITEDKMNLKLFLIKAKKGRIIWSNNYTEELTNIIELERKIAQTIARELRVQLTPEEKQRIEKNPTISLTAYDFYQRGRDELWKFEADNSKKEALENAEKYFLKALEYDSKFALAYTGLAKVYRDKNYYKEYFSEDFLDSVLLLANRALSFYDQLAEAYNLRGIYYFEKGNFKRAITEFDTALKFNPNLWEAYFFKGKLYWFEGKEIEQSIFNFHQTLLIHRGSSLALLFLNISQAYQYAGFDEQAKYYLREALSLNRDSANYYNNLAEIENNNRNYKESIKFGIKAIQYDSTNIWILNLLGFNYSMVTKHEESLKYYKKMIEILQKKEVLNISNMHRVGYAYFKNGLKKEANFYFNEQIKFCNEAIEMGRRYSSGFWAHYDLAAVYSFLGEKEKAFEYLRIFHQSQNMNICLFRLINDDPLLNNLRNEPEFQQIAAEIEHKYLAEHERVKKWLEENELL